MSKMREAADKHISDVDSPYKDQAFDDFCDGWKAAIAAVREGGAKAKIVWYPSGNEVFFINEDDVTNGELLYRLPED